jgi:L-alanine-DL-glutamate epimerase-like enolase superfamily enzyme
LHENTVEAIASGRDAAGPDVGLMVDVNCVWSIPDAIDMARQLRPLDLLWLEEPIWPPEDAAGLAEVRADGAIPVAAGENEATLAQYRQLIAAGAVDIIQPSVVKMGGITQLRQVFALAAANDIATMPHSFYDGPGWLATVQAVSALGPSTANRGSLIEWRWFEPAATLYGQAGRPARGLISPPTNPGLGMDPDADVIARYRID